MSSRKRNSVLWQILLPEDDNRHYLFGTMHLSDRGAYSHLELAEQYLKQCSLYAGEMHLEEAAQADMHQYFLLPQGWTYEQELSKAQYLRLKQTFFDVTGIEWESVSHLIPLAIQNMISESFIQSDYAMPLDQHLWQSAAAQAKTLFGLESVEDQKRVLLEMPLDYQLLGLKQMIRNVSKCRLGIQKLSELYIDGDIHALYRKSKKSMGRIKRLMIYDRNAHMVNRFCDIARNGSLFASVGAAHLSGQKGMLHLLQSQGAQITPVR